MRRLSWLVISGLLVTSCAEAAGPGSTGGSGGFEPGGSGGVGSGGTGEGGGGSGGTGGGDEQPVRLASAEIGPEGGVLTTPDGAVSIHVPFGALRSALSFTVDSVPSPTAGALGHVVELGPHGASFDLPVTILLVPVDGVVPERQRLGTVTGGAWTELPASTFDPFGFRLRAETTHFSEFGVIEVEPCDGDSDCAEGEICNPGSGRCVEPVSCDPEVPYGCDGAQSCVESESICRFVCQEAEYCQGHTDDDCDGTVDEGCPTCADVPGGAVCDGACVDTTIDSSHCGACGKACGSNAVCLDARCWPLGGDPCRTDGDCDEGLFCFEGYCEPEPIACTTDGDCPSFARCIEGFCY